MKLPKRIRNRAQRYVSAPYRVLNHYDTGRGRVVVVEGNGRARGKVGDWLRRTTDERTWTILDVDYAGLSWCFLIDQRRDGPWVEVGDALELVPAAPTAGVMP